MAKIGLIFGSDEGNTEAIAYRIQARLGADLVDVLDVADITVLDFDNYDTLILGLSTWDFGQIQSDWEDFWGDVGQVDFTGKTVALFGLGDQFGYGDYFLDAMGMLHDVIVPNGARIVGYWSTDGYDFDASKAQVAGENLFVGLGIDQDQQEDLTAGRLNRWCRQIHAELGLTSPIQDLDD
ncbi:flavodoxin [Simiduia agarivorans]|uniref:Flavodoxin n=1 Tax=Simiduia agarivorans (strain DSM 21679 / JCM 13881 / BCRC 17597 / SA1) TaxID=1117647 RepID=K4KGA8_SIMAS|nr:flavodoxin [Simiduia agarivorans]AFU98011.1 flavodoxin [Simiduia agarivorans SA1 = DSM 21679]